MGNKQTIQDECIDSIKELKETVLKFQKRARENGVDSSKLDVATTFIDQLDRLAEQQVMIKGVLIGLGK